MKHHKILLIGFLSYVSFMCGCNHTYNCDKQTTISGVDSIMSEVDLGLSVKWANMNLGAEKAQDFGEYYIIEDTIPYDTIPYILDLPDNWDEWYDSLGRIYPKYDMVSILTDHEWRMPTTDEWRELAEMCTWSWITYRGKEGFRIEGPNGNSIFLPAAGNIDSKYGDDPLGFYISSYIWDGGSTYAVEFKRPKEFNSPNIDITEPPCYYNDSIEAYFENTGCLRPASVRPVKVERK